MNTNEDICGHRIWVEGRCFCVWGGAGVVVAEENQAEYKTHIKAPQLCSNVDSLTINFYCLTEEPLQGLLGSCCQLELDHCRRTMSFRSLLDLQVLLSPSNILLATLV